MKIEHGVKAVFILWAISIVVLHLTPNSNLLASVRLTSSGFVLHCTGFFVGMLLWWLAVNKKGISFMLSGGLLISLMSVILEVVHFYLPYRTFNVYDMVANISGIGLFITIYLAYAGMKRRYSIGQK